MNEHYKQQRLNEDLCSKNLLGDDFKRKLEVRKTGRQGFLMQRGKHDSSVLSSALLLVHCLLSFKPLHFVSTINARLFYWFVRNAENHQFDDIFSVSNIVGYHKNENKVSVNQFYSIHVRESMQSYFYSIYDIPNLEKHKTRACC